jgi:hypothetical protein
MQRTGRTLSLLLSVILAGACWLAARGLGGRALAARETWPVGESLVWLPPPRAAPILAMGYRQLWADVNWARVLVYYGSNWREDVHFRFRYLTRFLDNIIALDPKFKRVYEWASYAVTFQGGTVEPEEYALSVRYLERAMEEYPEHYRYFWLAGIRYYIDLKSDDPAQQQRYREHGAALIEQAMLKPDAPGNLALLAAGLRTELGQRERALENLRTMIMSTDDPETQAKLIKTYQNLAGKEFPDEATHAKADLQQRWLKELSFAPIHMYVILGDRPSPAVSLESLAAESDIYGALMAAPDAADAADGQHDAAAPGHVPAPGAAVQTPAQRGAGATPGAP